MFAGNTLMNVDTGMKCIGIDLGTYNSAAAFAFSKANVVMVNSKEGKAIYGKNFPSFVYFPPRGEEIVVGGKAKEQLSQYPESVIWGVKRLIGISYDKAMEDRELLRFQYPIEKGPGGGITIRAGDRAHTPGDILEYIARKIKTDAENNQINPLIRGPIQSATVSVPAYYDGTRVSAIVDAVEKAGFAAPTTISEPSAAAHLYGLDIKEEAFILTFDMGAGTLDITITALHNVNGAIEQGEFAISGHEILGGIDIDEYIYADILTKYHLESYEEDPHSVAGLKREIENSKISLSECDSALLKLPDNRTVTYTRSEMERTLEPLLARCKGPLKTVLDGKGIHCSDIDYLLFVGGPTFMPCVRNTVFAELKNLGGNDATLRKLMDNSVFSTRMVNPMECVAKGAALKAMGYIKSRSLIDPNGYGTILPVKGLRDYYCSIIDPNSSYPLKSSIVVYQNAPLAMVMTIPLVKKLEYREADQSVSRFYHLGDYDCFLKPTGQNPRIKIELDIDGNKSLLMTFTHLQTDESVEFRSLNQLSGEEIFLQEENLPPKLPQMNRYDEVSAQYNIQNVWTEDHLKKAKKFAGFLLNREKDADCPDIVQKKMGDVKLLLDATDHESARFILRRCQELLDLMILTRIMTKEELVMYQQMLHKIVET